MYYSDHVRGARAHTEDEIPQPLWAALLALIERGLNSNLFAQHFPLRCKDGDGVYGCDRDSFFTTLRAEIPEVIPLQEYPQPPTLAVLDLLEFVHRHASEATEGPYHRFWRHHHLQFDREAGRSHVRESVNRWLGRQGTLYKLDARGRVIRLAPPAVAAQLRRGLPRTKDRRVDALLQTAIAKYLEPDPGVRREALEQLWDAFERSKTVLDCNKKRGAAALVVAATVDAPDEAHELETEMNALTKIGNTFQFDTTKPGRVSQRTPSSITCSRGCTP